MGDSLSHVTSIKLFAKLLIINLVPFKFSFTKQLNVTDSVFQKKMFFHKFHSYTVLENHELLRVSYID